MLINNLSAHLGFYRAAIDAAIKRVLDRAWLVLGPEVIGFEMAFAEYIRVNYCIGVANGTDALELALRALGINGGDKVATVANAGMYGTTAILATGSIPLFMDVNVNTQMVTQAEVVLAIEKGAKAIIVTHLYGRANPNIIEISAICKAAKVILIEDCAQAHGACINGKKVGSFGNVGCFSFYPTKNLGALGDGGAVVCNDIELDQKLRSLRQYGWSTKYQVELAGGCNSRLDEMQAAILSEFLPHLDGWNTRRRSIASEYSTRIKNPLIFSPPVGEENYVAHLYVVRCIERDSLRRHLREHGIATEVHYPIPDHRQPVFGKLFTSVHLPNTEQLANEVLTLPCYPQMTQADVDRVIAALVHWPANPKSE
ncbi:MAG: DegT/DnrJ/EryC1/StrS family aminotransferase [Glaciimonas sp.]|nr:DegT/DnrJ/EryC1/StrS family aminotransferase [Glaciimonas sp.]